jgi:hypothetical protein
MKRFPFCPEPRPTEYAVFVEQVTDTAPIPGSLPRRVPKNVPKLTGLEPTVQLEATVAVTFKIPVAVVTAFAVGKPKTIAAAVSAAQETSFFIVLSFNEVPRTGREKGECLFFVASLICVLPGVELINKVDILSLESILICVLNMQQHEFRSS